MARPRSVADAQILDEAVRLVMRYGPAELTFARLGRAVGLAPATLVQRFGTKRRLLTATAAHCLSDANEALDAASHAYASRIQAITEALATLAAPVRTLEAFTNGLAFLQVDLSDPKLHQLTRDGAVQMHTRLIGLLDEATAAGELVATDTDRLARTLQAAYHGALITWAMYHEGHIEDSVRSRLRDVIAPYRRR